VQQQQRQRHPESQSEQQQPLKTRTWQKPSLQVKLTSHRKHHSRELKR
jgi:hypothetical protein